MQESLNSSLITAPQVNLPSLISKAARVVTDQSQMRRGYYQRNHILVIEGHALFTDENTIVIQKDGSDVERIKADAFFIAVGSSRTDLQKYPLITLVFVTVILY